MLALKYCRRCVMPETNEGNEFDENGICRSCVSAEQKMHISWDDRFLKLREIVENIKADAAEKNLAYDCIVPISGGKDSVFQLHVLTKVLGLKVLTVTFSHNWYSKIGMYNLWNALEQFEVDHIQFSPNRNLISKAAKGSLEQIGDACWHCHSGVGAFPLHIAVKFKIPMLIWGESAAEVSGRATHFDPVIHFDRDYFIKISSKVTVSDFSKNSEEMRLFQMLEPPTLEECDEVGVVGIHLGDFIFWDEERQTEFIKKEYGWIEDKVEGAYKGYKSVECIMPGVHDFTNYLKRGFGRATVQASGDVRQGLMRRSEALEFARTIDSVEPNALNYFLEVTGYSKSEFYEIMEQQKKGVLKDQMIPVKNLDAEPIKKPFIIEFIDEIRADNVTKDTRDS
jgi:N-acetyl sugar amidotransferase